MSADKPLEGEASWPQTAVKRSFGGATLLAVAPLSAKLDFRLGTTPETSGGHVRWQSLRTASVSHRVIPSLGLSSSDIT